MLGRLLLIAGVLLVFAAPARASLSALDNGVVRIGVDLQQGGKITWLSSAGGRHADNMLWEAEQSFYDGSWHGFQDPATVVDHSNDGHTLYTRAVDEPDGAVLETWITLHGHAAVVRNKLTSFWTGASSPVAAGQELPALYTIGPRRLVTYEGSRPWTNAPVADISRPTPDIYPSEHWAALLDDSGFGVGLVEPDIVHMVGSTDYLAGTRPELIDANAVYEYTYTLVVGTVAQIRAYAYAHRADLRPNYLFAHDRQHFTEINATDNGFPIDGALRVHLAQDDPQLDGPETEWPAGRVPRLYIRAAWHSTQTQAEVFWAHQPGAFSGRLSRSFEVIPDGQFRTYRVDLFRTPTYRYTIRQLRLDLSASSEPGGWVDLTCISYKPCPIDRAAERRLASDGGRIPLFDSFDSLDASLWSITGNSTGASARTADGRLVVNIDAGARPLPGQTFVAAGVYSRCTVGGNFDVQVSYVLDTWPGGDDVHLNFSVGAATLYRSADRLGFYDPPLGGGAMPSGLPATGTLRLMRSDGVIRGDYRDAQGDWIEAGVANTPNAPVNVGLSLSNGNLAATPAAMVAFDDFRIVRGTLNCQ